MRALEKLPRFVKDRVVDKKYFFKNKHVTWDGRYLKCEHQKLIYRCILCKGKQICDHNKRQSCCVICNGTSVCKHLKEKSHCRKCFLVAVCIHDKLKSQCDDCRGNIFCRRSSA